MIKLAIIVLSLQVGIVFPLIAVTVDLRSDETLKPFFDAGLRPVRVRGSVGQCEIGPTPVTFLLSGGKSVSFEVQRALITVDRHDRISGIQAVTRYLTLEEARKQSKIIHENIQKPFEPCLEYLKKVEANYIWPGSEYGIASDTKPKISIGFQGGESKERPLRMMFSIVWPREWKGVDRRREPIKPPRGYESVSMEPLSIPNLKSRDGLSPHEDVLRGTKKAIEAKSTLKTPVEESTSSTLWAIIVVMIIAASCLLWLLLKGRK